MSRLQLRHKARMEPRRWFCSEPTPPPPPPPSSKEKPSKNSEASKEKTVATVNSYIQRCLPTNSGVFPKLTEVHDKVGGSWHSLKDVLGEMKSKMIPNSQDGMQIVAEASEEVVKEKYRDDGKLDGNNVEDPYTLEVKDSQDLSFAEVSDSAWITEPKQIERTIEMSDVGNSQDGTLIFAETSKEDIVKKRNKGNRKLDENNAENPFFSEVNSEESASVEVSDCALNPVQKQAEETVNLSEVKSSHTTKVEGLSNLGLVKISDKVELAEVKQVEDSIEVLDVEKSHEELIGLEDNLLAKGLDHSTRGIIVEKKDMLSSFFEKPREKRKELNETKIASFKHQESSNSKDNRYIRNLVDALKKSQNDSVGDKSINEDKLQLDGSMDVKEESREAAEKTDLKGMINHILQLSTETPKSEPKPIAHSNNGIKFNRKMKSQLNESNDEVKVRKSEIQTQKHKRHKISSSNFGVKKDNDNKNNNKCGNCSQLNKKEREMGESDESDIDIAAFDYRQPEPNSAIPLPYHRPSIDALPSEQTDSPKYTLLMKFLPKTANTYHINLAFGNCGSISEIRIIDSGRQNRFNYAYISFKTAEEMKEALSKDDITVCDKDVILEQISSSNAENKIYNADSVTDSIFPKALLKSPSRAIMVKGLTEDLPFHYLTYVFSNWGQISNTVMGCSPSVAFVEFKSEDAKERVLAEGVVYINGKKLTVLRVDSPKTTVVRISNVNPSGKLEKIHSICDSNGQVKRIVKRDAGIFDVYFSSSEWTNMMQILNRLNGQLVDQHQWIAQPATVIPAQVLQSMWNTSAGRMHVHEMYQSICSRIAANSMDTAPVLHLAKEYYGDSY